MDRKEQVKKIITDLCDGCEVDGVSTGLIVIASKEIAALYSSQEPQSVSTPTEGMELSESEILGLFPEFKNSPRALRVFYANMKPTLLAQVAKVLANLPTEQEIRESERKEIYAEISKDLNEAVILHNEIKPNGNVMVKGGFIAELQKKYVAKLRSLVIPKEV